MANDNTNHSHLNRIFSFVIRAGALGAALIIAAALTGPQSAAGRAFAVATPAASPTPANHEVTFKNNCNQAVWIANLGNGDVVPKTWELAPSCDPDVKNSCPSGSTCDGHQCTCTTPGPGAKECMGGLCGKNHLCVTSEVVPVPATYSGRFWPRTGCDKDGTNCVTGDCGGIDCDKQGKTANNATLWEMTLGGLPPAPTSTPTSTPTPGFGSNDNYDVSLVSGYNIPVDVVAHAPTDAPGWQAKHQYHNGQGGDSQSVIVAPAGQYHWLLNDVGSASTGTSGITMPAFKQKLLSNVQDPSGSNDILWSTTNSTCQEGNCLKDLLATCPADLRVDGTIKCSTNADCVNGSTCASPSKGKPKQCEGVVACSAADTYCQDNPSSSICTAQNKAFFLCLNTVSGEKDPFGNSINLESVNAATPVCFSSSDCAPGTECLMNPTFTKNSKLTFPAGAGICVPGNGTVTQNGGCTSADDGNPCPDPNFVFPFPDYTCATLTNDPSGQDVSVCVPPVTVSASGAAAFGKLVWNADNFAIPSPTATPTATATPAPTPTPCTKDSDCSTASPPTSYCLQNNSLRQAKSGSTVLAQAVDQCASSSKADCGCYSVKHCSTDADCTADTKCLNSSGLACAGGSNCLCQTDAIYTGTCGATNANWTAANNAITASDGNNYLDEFKKVCPSAYSYQFDDASSDWSCGNTTDQLTSYTVTFCGYGGKGLTHVTPAQP